MEAGIGLRGVKWSKMGCKRSYVCIRMPFALLLCHRRSTTRRLVLSVLCFRDTQSTKNP